MRNHLTLLAALLLLACSCGSRQDLFSIREAAAGELDRIEPPCWWTGMKTSLQLMVHGEGISDREPRIEGLDGVTLGSVHKAGSPNYLFLDINVGHSARPGTAQIVFKGEDGDEFRVPYEFAARPSDKGRVSFSTQDLIYLIVPDRFANGDPSNDETPDTHDYADKTRDNARHGGDIEGIIGRLDYLQDLGVTALWPTPLLEDNARRVSYHGYACSDYYRIDPRFGSNDQYREMVLKAHEKGIKIIMDVVTNHCGSSHWWMQDLPFMDWIHQHDPYENTNHVMSVAFDPNASLADREQMEDGWFVPSMPDMNLDNPFVLKYFQQWAVWWIAWSGLDGFRVDTWFYNEKEPIAQWAKAVRDEFPWFNIVGEVWTLHPDFVAYWQEGHPNLDGFDSHLPTVMDFPLQNAINRALADPEGDHGLSDIGSARAIYDALSHDFGYSDTEKILIFLSNHDTPRIADVFGADPAKMRIALTLIATIRGIPQVFYGDELMLRTGTCRRNDGRLRMDFPDDWAEDETASELHDYARALFRWRRECSAIHHGRTVHFLPQDNCYVFFRYDDASVVMVIANLSDKALQLPWERYSEVTAGLSEGVDPLTGESVNVSEPLEAAPREARVVEFRLDGQKNKIQHSI